MQRNAASGLFTKSSLLKRWDQRHAPVKHLGLSMGLPDCRIIILEEALHVLYLQLCKKGCVVGVAVHAAVRFSSVSVSGLLRDGRDAVFNGVRLFMRHDRAVGGDELPLIDSINTIGYIDDIAETPVCQGRDHFAYIVV